MLDEIRLAVTRSGYPYARIAMVAGLAHNSVYALFADDANPTIKTLEKIKDSLLHMPNKCGKECGGCKHNEGIERFDEGQGVICAAGDSVREPTGCAYRETADATP